MMEAISIEIFRQEAEESRVVNLSIQADGSLRLQASDMGPTVKRIWNDDDYEFLGRCTPGSSPQAPGCSAS
jgi:hypothetical protein